MGGPVVEERGHSWLPSSPCTPGCLPPTPTLPLAGRARRAVRATVRGAAVAVLLACGALMALAAPLLSARLLAAVQRRWALALLAATGVRLRRTGRAPAPSGADAPGTLVVANHVSWLDVLALHAVAPVRMLAKREVRTWPLIGAMAARAGTVFLDRDRLRDLPAAVADLAGALRAGGSIGVFPEGTTRCGRALGSFRPAAFQAAVDGAVVVQPVALRYGDGGAAFVGDDTLFSSLGRVLTARRVDLELVVLAPLEPRDGVARHGRACARRDLARRAEAAVATELGATVAAMADVEADLLAGRVGEEVLDRVA